MTFTATKDLMLPATVTGSWPRPRWYTMNMWGRPLDTALMEPWYRDQFTDAHAIVVSDQERAGLDIMTTGDYHLDEDVAGRSWHHYPLQRWKGLEHEELQYERSRDSLLAFPPGTLLVRDDDRVRVKELLPEVDVEQRRVERPAPQALVVPARPPPRAGDGRGEHEVLRGREHRACASSWSSRGAPDRTGVRGRRRGLAHTAHTRRAATCGGQRRWRCG